MSSKVLFRFVITGGGAAAIFIVSAFLLRSLLNAPAFVASGAAFLISFAFAYPLQRWWTFGGRHTHRAAFPRYLVTQLGCLILSALVSQCLVDFLGAQPIVMAVMTAGIVSIASFCLSRFWVFAE